MKELYFKKNWRLWGALLLITGVVFLLAVPRAAVAQTLISGDIAGTVTDQSGAAIPGAKVTVTNTGTGAAKSVTTGAAGDYRVPLLQPGSYQITVAASGFQGVSQPTTVSAGTISSVNVHLSVGSATQTVQVSAAAPLLHTESAQLSTTFAMQQVQTLPNPGNDLTFVAQTAPGSVMNTQSGYGNFSAFGLPATSNTFTVNGGYENDPYLNVNNSGATNLLLGNNDIQDVTVVSNAYDAAFGGLGGAQINEITRSGTNQFHGDLDYWWNGRVMNANDYFNKQSATARPFDNVNQWAAAIGGPIRKNKTFFFMDTEGLRVVLPTRATVWAPDASYEALTYANLAANGLASETALYKKIFDLYDNAPGRSAATVSTADSAAGGYGTVQFNGTAGNFTHEWLLTARVDQNISDNDHLFGHFEYDKGVQATYTSVLNPIFNADSPQPQWSGQLNETHTFSPNVVNQFILSDIHYQAVFANTQMSQAVAMIPFSLIFADGDLGNNSPSAWPGGYDLIWPQGRSVEGYEGEDDLSWTRNQHTIKIGWTMRRDDVTDFSPSEFTASPEAVDLNSSFQNGTVDEWFQQFPTRLTQPVALYTMGAYIQDEWKVKPGLTLTYGLRVEHNSNPVCQTNCFARLPGAFSAASASPNAPYNKIILSGRHRAFTGFQHVGWEPRVGIAWLPFGPGSKTTVRTGFGMFADAFPGQIADAFMNNAPTNVPFTILSQNFGNSAAPAAGYPLDPTVSGSAAKVAAASNAAFQSGFATGATLNTLSAVPGFSAPSITTSAAHIYFPTYEEWSMAVEQQLRADTVATIEYVGNRSYHQPVQNQSVNAFGFGSLPANDPNPNFGASTEVDSSGSSNFNGMVASIMHRSRYITLQANYAYSHALDDVSNGGFDGFSGNSVFQSNPNNLAQQYGNSDYDTRHYISGSYLIMIPHWIGPKVVTGDWTLAGTVFHNDGFPFSITADTVASQIANYGPNPNGRLYAKQIAPLKSNHCGGGSHSINGTTPCSFVSDFAEPTDFGQGRRNSVYGPSYTDTDLSVLKGFKLPKLDTGRLELGAQFFNLFNHPNFAQPSGNFDGSSFGFISGTVNTPTSILGAFLGGDASPRLIQFKAKIQF